MRHCTHGKKCTSLGAALVLALAVTVAAPADTDGPLEQRVDQLEQRVAELERQPPLTVQLLELSYVESTADNLYANDRQPWLTVHLRVTNNLGRETQAVRGDLLLSDADGAPWWRLGLDIDQVLRPQASIEWIGRVDFNLLSSAHQRARDADPLDVVARMELHEVVFDDGSRVLY